MIYLEMWINHSSFSPTLKAEKISWDAIIIEMVIRSGMPTLSSEVQS